MCALGGPFSYLIQYEPFLFNQLNDIPLQALYREDHLFGVFPVELNDVIVGITMLVASLIQVGQCIVYDVRMLLEFILQTSILTTLRNIAHLVITVVDHI